MSVDFIERVSSPSKKYKDGIPLLNHGGAIDRLLWHMEWDADALFFDDGTLYLNEEAPRQRILPAIVAKAENIKPHVDIAFVKPKIIKDFLSELDEKRAPAREYSQEDAQAELRKILKEGDRLGASDVHIELRSESCRIAFRIHGIIREGWELQSHKFGKQLLSAAFIICDQREPSENEEKPQYGQFSPNLKLGINTKFNSVRCNWIRTAEAGNPGRLLNLRLQHSLADLGDFTDMGFTEEDQRSLRQMRKLAEGLLFALGPMGHGKTSLLSKQCELQYYEFQGEQAFISIEDPAEYNLPFPQISVNAGYDPLERTKEFNEKLSAALRTDADRAFIGELRDKIAINTALTWAGTGHPAWTSQHVHSVVELVPQLINMGVKNPAVFNPKTIAAAVAMRLMSELCSCKVPITEADQCDHHTAEDIAETKAHLDACGVNLHDVYVRGKGCHECDDLGVTGRLPVCEFLFFDDEIMSIYKTLKSDASMDDEAAQSQVRTLLRARQVPTLHDSALRRITRGEIDPVTTEIRLGAFSPSKLHVPVQQTHARAAE